MRLITRDSADYVEIFHQQQMQFIDWTRRGQPGGDIETYGITKALFRVPGCVTRYCCESHPTKHVTDYFYIMLLASAEGHRHLSAILARMNVHRSLETKGPVLHLIEMANVGGLLNQQRAREAVMIPTSIFETRLTREDKRKFLWLFQSTIEAYIEDMGYPTFDDVVSNHTQKSQSDRYD